MSNEATGEPLCLHVRVDAARAEALAREIGLLEPGGFAPLSYPALWLTQSQIHDAVTQICAEADSVPVHESQRFSYAEPLRLDAEYRLTVSMRREETPPRLIVEAQVLTMDGNPVGRMHTQLRLVPRALLRVEKSA